jgi:hypothetical protein
MSRKLDTARDRVVEPEIFTRGQRLVTEPLTTSSSNSERCQNPVCNTPLEPLENGWRRTQRRFCSDGCKMDAWAIRRVRKLLENETDERALAILRGKP